MIIRKSTNLALMVLLTLVIVSCNNNYKEVATQPSQSNANSSIPARTNSPTPNTPATNQNSNIFSPSIPGESSSVNTEEEEYFKRIARENRPKPRTYGNRKVKVSPVIEYKGHPQLYRLIGHCLDNLCEKYKYEVHLRNGKICELPEGKIQNPLTASPEEILEAIGDCIRD